VDIEIIAGLVAFAALIAVWAFAPTKPRVEPSRVAVPREALA